MDESILRDLAVLLVTVNRVTMNNRSSAPVPDQARRRLCEALGVQRLDESPDEVAARLRAVLGLAEAPGSFRLGGCTCTPGRLSEHERPCQWAV
jgi:hypothetical protein